MVIRRILGNLQVLLRCSDSDIWFLIRVLVIVVETICEMMMTFQKDKTGIGESGGGMWGK